MYEKRLCGKYRYLPFNKILGFFSQKSKYSHLCLILRMKVANLYYLWIQTSSTSSHLDVQLPRYIQMKLQGNFFTT